MSRPPEALGPLIVGVAGHRLTAQERMLLRHPWVGGVILFARNYADPEQLGALCAEIRDLREPRLLIQVDQEGGPVQRFGHPFTPLPPLAALGRWYAQHPERACDMAYRHGRVMAAEVLAAGVDQSLAPVLDLMGVSRVIGHRAFATAPQTVIDLAGHYIAGMGDAGMAACGKHFPGHGSVAPDSHHEVVTDTRSLDALADDLAPFRALAPSLPAIMMAHVRYPAVDEHPAGFSPRWVGEVLRTQLGYGGVVISDDLDMAGAATAGDLGGRLRAALAAGCDLALVCRPASADEAVRRLPGPPADATRAIARLYGRPQFSLAEQLTVPEFRAWQASLTLLARDYERHT